MFVKGKKDFDDNRKSEGRAAARAKREAIIKKALDDGVPLHKTNGSLSDEERETLIRLDYLTGQAFVDSSISADITKFINRGWKITSVTKSGKDNTVQAMTFVGPAKKISVGSVTGQSDDE